MCRVQSPPSRILAAARRGAFIDTYETEVFPTRCYGKQPPGSIENYLPICRAQGADTGLIIVLFIAEKSRIAWLSFNVCLLLSARRKGRWDIYLLITFHDS